MYKSMEIKNKRQKKKHDSNHFKMTRQFKTLTPRGRTESLNITENVLLLFLEQENKKI